MSHFLNVVLTEMCTGLDRDPYQYPSFRNILFVITKISADSFEHLDATQNFILEFKYDGYFVFVALFNVTVAYYRQVQFYTLI